MPSWVWSLLAWQRTVATRLRVVHATRPDVLVVDSDMPDLKGLQVAETLRSDGTEIGIVLYTLDGDACIDSAASGVDACVTKDSPASVLIDAIHRAAQSSAPVQSTTTPRRHATTA